MGACGSLRAVHSTLRLLPPGVSSKRGFFSPEDLDRIDAARSALAPPAGTPSPRPDDVSDSDSVCYSTPSERDDDEVSLDESVTDSESDGDGGEEGDDGGSSDGEEEGGEGGSRDGGEEGSGSGGAAERLRQKRGVNRRRQRRGHVTPVEDRDPGWTPGNAGKIHDEKEVKASLVYSLVAVFHHIVGAIFRSPPPRRASPQLKKTVTQCDEVVSLVCVRVSYWRCNSLGTTASLSHVSVVSYVRAAE